MKPIIWYKAILERVKYYYSLFINIILSFSDINSDRNSDTDSDLFDNKLIILEGKIA